MNPGFHRGIQPVLREYRRKWRESSSPHQRPLSRIRTPSDNLSYDPPIDFNDAPPPSDTQSIPILLEPSDVSSSSYATALEESEPPTTHDDLTQHEGKTLQQMIEEGAGSSQQNYWYRSIRWWPRIVVRQPNWCRQSRWHSQSLCILDTPSTIWWFISQSDGEKPMMAKKHAETRVIHCMGGELFTSIGCLRVW